MISGQRLRVRKIMDLDLQVPIGTSKTYPWIYFEFFGKIMSIWEKAYGQTNYGFKLRKHKKIFTNFLKFFGRII